MALLTLTVQNPSLLPAGVAPSCRMTGRSLAIGRDPRLDWVLPDPSRTISGRHCDIRFENGGFWLHDHSRNGVFVNGSAQRLMAAYRLANGDRLLIGRYVIAVAITEPAHAGKEMPADPIGSFAGARSERQPEPFRDMSGRKTSAQPPPQPAFRAQRAENASARAPVAGTVDGFLEAFCEAAGMSSELLADRDRRELAGELGQFVRITVEQLGLLLKSRAAAKAMTRSAARTVLGAADNNPLKFVPDAIEAAETMFGRRRSGYLDARRSLEDAFGDLRRHELASYAAMQKALARLLEPLAPDVIEAKAGGALFNMRKSRAWEIYVERWEERNRSENGLLDAFFLYFAEAYDDEVADIDL